MILVKERRAIMQFLPFDRDERAKLKPVAGDLLDFLGVHYVAEQVGLKYVVAHLASDPKAKCLLKISAIAKVTMPEQTPPLRWTDGPSDTVPRSDAQALAKLE